MLDHGSEDGVTSHPLNKPDDRAAEPSGEDHRHKAKRDHLGGENSEHAPFQLALHEPLLVPRKVPQNVRAA